VDGDGRNLTLADFEGRVVLLNIWATWCPPCREEMPTLDALQARLGGSDFHVLPLSIDRAGLEPVRRFYRETGIRNLDLYIAEDTRAMLALAVVGLPTTILIDRIGRERGRLAGPAEWNSPEAVAQISALIDERKQ
jgi:thiol-disulfide isomerase/thioredoxin|tara:strand:+ start:2966 stop:3373 length:408 start_codon:yes stop_codon:yes gene_type:complete